MKVETNIKKTDIIYMQYYFIPRLKKNIFMYFVLFLLPILSSGDMIKEHGVFASIVSAFILVNIIFFTVYTVLILISSLFLTKARGDIGKQLIEVDDVYFSETTAGTQTKTKWIGIDKLFKSKRYIYVMISGFRAHIIPKRSFENDAQFESFWQLINKHYANK